MARYKAPLADIRYLMREVIDFRAHYAQLPGCGALGMDEVDMVLAEAARFAEDVLHPLYRSGDENSCRFENGNVYLPQGYKEARELFVRNGWSRMAAAERWGGQALPGSLGMICNEMMGAVNPPWVMLVGLPHAVMHTLDAHGSEEQRQQYFPGLVDGRWGATMCLTEPHCGTDLGLIRTKAEPQADGSYRITGTKIFISFGENDVTENIIHLVLAKLPGVPEGTAGISMFIVPKFRVNPDGSNGARNAVHCGSIEHKMGYMASPTCVMNFDGAAGWLVGQPNDGLKYMFTLMNNARIGSGVQALGLADASHQGAVAYARERLQMRSLTGPKNPGGPADPIIVHPGVRQLLLTQKSLVEGCRWLVLEGARLADLAARGETPEIRRQANAELGFLTPIIKGFITEAGYECTNHGVQVMGGHGYMREHGMEQLVRDCRISTIYEGTTQVQALDLIGRKTLMAQGKPLAHYAQQVQAFIAAQAGNEKMKPYCAALTTKLAEWQQLTGQVMAKSFVNFDEAGAASVDYLMYAGYVVVACGWARMAAVSSAQLAAGTGDRTFHEAKLHSADFYFARILPRTLAHREAMLAGADTLMAMPAGSF
ncbi:MAG: acyl-CoA dehydrogenase C-terminal domain-containing protein [Pseudomonadota bacterium]